MTSRSARVWSLWDMVASISMGSVVHLLEEIGLQVTLASRNKQVETQFASEEFAADEKNQEAIRETVEALRYIVEAGGDLQALVKSAHIENAIQRLQHWINEEPKSWGHLFVRSCTLRDAIRIEFKQHLFYAYPFEKGRKLTEWDTAWQSIHAAFPEVKTDSFCATDCYALGHNTASVFHSMRVAEAGLRALSKERRIKLPRKKPIEWGTWQEIIKALDEEIRVIGQTWRAGARKDAALEFYSGARADLNGFKDEFRNLVMHVRLHYDEFQAARALARVHDFMSRIAEKLDHKHNRIKWGR